MKRGSVLMKDHPLKPFLNLFISLNSATKSQRLADKEALLIATDVVMCVWDCRNHPYSLNRHLICGFRGAGYSLGS